MYERPMMGDNIIDWRLLKMFGDHFKGQTPDEFRHFLKKDGFDLLETVLMEYFGPYFRKGEFERLKRGATLRINVFLSLSD